MQTSLPAPTPLTAASDNAPETPQPHIAMPVLISALCVGFIADQLLHRALFGVNILIVTALFCAALFLAARRAGVALRGGGRFFAIPAIALAACLALRDTVLLRSLTVLALLACIAIVSFRAQATRVLVGSLKGYALAVMSALFTVPTGAFFVASNVRWRNNSGGAFVRVAFGMLIAAPLLLVFGALFAMADPSFGKLMQRLFNIESMLEHALLTLFLSWSIAGLLWQALSSNRALAFEQELPKRNPAFGFGAIEIAIVLGLLNALFATFVFTQLRYFFGGAALVLNIADTSNTLTFAEYARRGFFELVLVAALVLGMLLTGHFLTRRDQPLPMRVFRVLSLILIGLLYVIIASALHRMWTYMQAYGLTELRIYTTAFMLWLALVFAWFIATTLRGSADRFAFGFVISAIAVLIALNLLNPIEFIVRHNIERITDASKNALPEFASERIDAAYLANLARNNADALPPLMSNLSRFDAADRCVIAAGLADYFRDAVYGAESATVIRGNLQGSGDQLRTLPFDWRGWNYARARARALVTPEVYTSYVNMACFDNRELSQ